MTLKAKRGKRITLKVNNKDDALNIRIKAQQKWIQFYPNLYNVERDYLLLYESGELIENLPGSSEKFSLQRYREEIDKDYKRITLYLCMKEDFLCQNEENDPVSQDKKIKLDGDLDFPLVEHWFSENIVDINEQEIPMAASEQENIMSIQQPSTSSVEKYMYCPICNQRFPIGEIQEHADVCSEKQVYKCLVLQPKPDLSSPSPEEADGDDAVMMIDVSREELAAVIKGFIKDLPQFDDIDDDQVLKIPVRRGFCFEDFRNYFDKKWNAKKKNMKYQLEFIGEAGVDTSGLSRDFYTGEKY